MLAMSKNPLNNINLPPLKHLIPIERQSTEDQTETPTSTSSSSSSNPLAYNLSYAYGQDGSLNINPNQLVHDSDEKDHLSHSGSDHGAIKQKRLRRKCSEVTRIYMCGYRGCTKSYGTLNHLNTHIISKNHGTKRKSEHFKELQKQLKLRRHIELRDDLQTSLINTHNTTISMHPTSNYHLISSGAMTSDSAMIPSSGIVMPQPQQTYSTYQQVSHNLINSSVPDYFSQPAAQYPVFNYQQTQQAHQPQQQIPSAVQTPSFQFPMSPSIYSQNPAMSQFIASNQSPSLSTNGFGSQQPSSNVSYPVGYNNQYQLFNMGEQYNSTGDPSSNGSSQYPRSTNSYGNINSFNFNQS